MRSPYKNLTVALPPAVWVDLRVMMSRFDCKSYSELILKLIQREKENPSV